MPESGEFNKERYRFIIYHGYIHILAINEDFEDQVNLHNKKFLNSDLFLYKKEHK